MLRLHHYACPYLPLLLLVLLVLLSASCSPTTAAPCSASAPNQGTCANPAERCFSGACKACLQTTKQKALYASASFAPSLASRPAFAIDTEVQWMSTASLRAWNANGIYDAFMTYFAPAAGKTRMGGYFGAQIKGGMGSKPDMLLFSMWDKHPGEGDAWQAALPRHANCQRNCNDCAVHSGPGKAPDGSTGTKCFVNIPKQESGATFRLRIRRVAVASTAELYGRNWTGDEYEVSAVHVQSNTSWVVGRQLIDTSLAGMNGMSTFHEHLGCTVCRSFEFASRRRGPWVVEPAGTILASVRAYANGDDAWECRAQQTTAVEVGMLEFRTGMADVYVRNRSAWNKDPLYTCLEGSNACEKRSETGEQIVPSPAAMAAPATAGGGEENGTATTSGGGTVVDDGKKGSVGGRGGAVAGVMVVMVVAAATGLMWPQA